MSLQPQSFTVIITASIREHWLPVHYAFRHFGHFYLSWREYFVQRPWRCWCSNGFIFKDLNLKIVFNHVYFYVVAGKFNTNPTSDGRRLRYYDTGGESNVGTVPSESSSLGNSTIFFRLFFVKRLISWCLEIHHLVCLIFLEWITTTAPPMGSKWIWLYCRAAPRGGNYWWNSILKAVSKYLFDFVCKAHEHVNI